MNTEIESRAENAEDKPDCAPSGLLGACVGMDKPFFVMLNNQQQTKLLPLMSDEDGLAMFGSREEATYAAEKNPMGEAFGYDIFEAGCGV